MGCSSSSNLATTYKCQCSLEKLCSQISDNQLGDHFIARILTTSLQDIVEVCENLNQSQALLKLERVSESLEHFRPNLYEQEAEAIETVKRAIIMRTKDVIVPDPNVLQERASPKRPLSATSPVSPASPSAPPMILVPNERSSSFLRLFGEDKQDCFAPKKLLFEGIEPLNYQEILKSTDIEDSESETRSRASSAASSASSNSSCQQPRLAELIMQRKESKTAKITLKSFYRNPCNGDSQETLGDFGFFDADGSSKHNSMKFSTSGRFNNDAYWV